MRQKHNCAYDSKISSNQLSPIIFEALKAIDIKDTNQTIGVGVLSNGVINFVHQPELWKNQSSTNYQK